MWKWCEDFIYKSHFYVREMHNTDSDKSNNFDMFWEPWAEILWKVIIPVIVRTKGGVSNPKFLMVVVMIPNRIKWEEKKTYWSIRLSKKKKITQIC